MKLSSDAAVTRILYEGITNFDSLSDFDKSSIEGLPETCREKIAAVTADATLNIAAEPEIPSANIGSISIRRLLVAMNAVKYYQSIDRTINPANMHYGNVLSGFKLEWEAYRDLRKQDELDVPLVKDKDGERKIIKWAPVFLDCMSRTYGSKGPLSYVLRGTSDVTSEVEDPLVSPNDYFGTSGSLLDELISRLPHTGPIYKNDNKTVFMKLEKAVRGTAVESTVKVYARRNDGRGAFFALISNHAGDAKYRTILKKRMNMLQNIKWNGRNYPLETHVSNHRQAVDDLRECSEHITVAVPDEPQRVEYLIDSITCQDNTLQAAIGLIRANTNNMRENFETAASAIIEVDPYRRSQRGGPTPRNATVSAIDFAAGRGSTGVDLRWHPRKEFYDLSQDQKEELTAWQRSDEGRKVLKASRESALKKRKPDSDSNKSNKGNGTWKKKFKKALKTPNGLKTVMSLLAEEEKSNVALVAALNTANNGNGNVQQYANTPLPPAPQTHFYPPPSSDNANVSSLSLRYPATQLKLNSILKNRKPE